MGRLDKICFGIGALFLAMLASQFEDMIRPEQAAPAGKIIVISEREIPANGTAARGFAAFSETLGYFGAFAMSSEGQPAFSYQHSTLHAAKQRAVSDCAQWSAEPCTVYVVMTPAKAQDFLPTSMSAKVVETYCDYARSCGGRGAFAIADNGAYGHSTRHDESKEAQSLAMSACTEHAYDPDAPRSSTSQCRIVEIW